MKKIALLLGLMVATVGVAIADDVVPFPFFQHGSGVSTFFSATNVDETDAVTITIDLKDLDGVTMYSTTMTVDPGACWLPSTGQPWCRSDSWGYGTFTLQASADVVYLWGCVYGMLEGGSAQAGFTLVLPGNPYGI